MNKNPKSIRLYKKWVIKDKFNPYKPSEELENELFEWILPNSDYIGKEFRGMPIGKIDAGTASYIAFEARMGKPELRLMAKIRYYILDAQDSETTKQELYDSMTGVDGEIFKLIPSINADYLKKEWEITDD